MDYDDNDAQEQNLHLTGEGSSKVSPVLHSYPLPKFDFDDNLQEHLRFDSLVENEVFLGITSQEDNQWIEEYSRGASAIPFNSSVAESRNQNVWSEATSSESVEMLLKSVGQEEKVIEETMIEELDPNLKQCDENDPNEFQENFVESKVSDDCEQSHVTFTSQSQETQISHEGLDSVVLGDKDGLSFGEKKVDKTCDDANQEDSNLANEMQEDPSVTKVECEIEGSIQNMPASVEECQNNPVEVPETLDENASDLLDNFNSSEPEHIDKTCDDANQEGSDLANESFVTELQGDSYVSKEIHSSEPEHNIDDICDDANEEGSNLANATFANELQDLSVFKVEGGIAGSSQNVDASVEENPQEVLEIPNEITSDLSQNLNSSEPEHIRKIHDDANEEDINLANELQEDASVSKVEDASIEGFQENECVSDVSKNFDSSEPEHVDKLCDDANQKGSDLGSESFVNELHQDLSVSMVECGNVGSSQNMDASIEECQDNSQEVLETVDGNASDLNFHNSEPEQVDKIPDDGNQEGSNLASESLANKLQEDPSVSEVENVGRTLIAASSSAEMPVEDILSKDEGAENNAPNIDTGVSNQSFPVKIPNLAELDDETQSLDDETQPLDDETQPLDDETQPLDDETQPLEPDPLDFKDMDIDDVGAPDSQKHAEPSSSENNAPNIDTMDSNPSLPVKISGVAQVGDETQSSEPDAVCMDQDFTFNERGDTTLPLDFKDIDMDVDRAPDSQKNVEPSLSAEVCEEATVMAQGSQPNMALLPDAVADMESSKISSLDTQEADIVAEDQPRSPILGVSLLHDDNEGKVEAGGTPKTTPQVDSALDDPLPSGTVARADIDTKDQPKLTILGVDLLQNDNEEKGGVGGSCQKGTLEVEKDADSHCDLPVGSCDVGPNEQKVDDNPSGLKCSKPLETSSLPFDSSTKDANKSEAGGLLDPKESTTGEDEVGPLNSTVNISDEQQASIVVPGPSGSEKEGGSASLDKPHIFSFSDTKNIELSQSEKDKHVVTMENTPLSEISKEGDGLQSVSSISATKEVKNFTFEVTGQTGIQNLNLPKVPSLSSSGGLLDFNKFHEDSLVSPQTASVAVAPSESGAKKTSERKPRRRSVGKETAKKGNQLKETTPKRRSGTEKSSALITSPATGPNESRLDLNNPTSILQQSFTDNQQVQLRAQILVYGSLISGMSPEEPHMIAAFGQSDSGRKAWEAAWHACIERVHGHKSQVNNPQTPLHLRSGNRDIDQGTKTDSAQSKVLSTPIITGSVVSPMIPISSPLWNMPTPQGRLQSTPTPRSPLFDYRQTLSPLHSFQTQRVQTLSGHNPTWPSQLPFPGQWVASSPVSPFTARFSSLPITEAVKLTTVKESGASGIPITPVEHTAGPLISPIPSSISHMKNTIVSSGQPSNESKSRKRKKATATMALSQTPVPSPTPVTFLTPVSITPKTNPFLSALSPGSSHGQPRLGDGNIEKTVTKEETMSKVEESKLQATEAAKHAAVAVAHCQDVWSQLEKQKSSGLVSDDEAKLASSAVSIAAAASVAKVAAAAAKIASNVAEQARLMADEVFLSSRTEFHKSTPDSILKSDLSTSVISVAREAARRRIEAASAASKHAENLDAIVKAAELAAEAVSQSGKIVAMGKPLSLSELVEAGPEGYWKTPQGSNKRGYSDDKQNVGAASLDKKIQTLKHGLSLQGHSGDLAKDQMMITGYEIDKSKIRASSSKDLDLSKTIGVAPELEVGPIYTRDVDQVMPESTSPTWKDTNITEGCLVEVYKDDNKNKGAWFAANVLTLKDGKALVCYTEIQSDEGSGKLKEWVPLEAEGSEAPRIRIAHPMTMLRFEGTKKRGRTVLADYSWCSGDQVDVWVQDSWHEAVVVETNKIDVTSLTVQFPAQGKTSVVRSWHVRPTLIYKDGKWIEWSSLKGCRSSEGDTPQEKRQKFDKEKDKSWNSVDVETGRHQESRIPTLSIQKSSFDVGKTSMDEIKQKTRGPIRTGLQKERSRVVFGVPKPGKKQKFMDVSRHYVGDGSNLQKNSNAPNTSVKKIFVNDSLKEKEVAEVKSKSLKPRKPPVPTVARSLSQKDKPKSSVSDKNSVDGKLPGQQKETGVGSSSIDVPLNTPKQSSTSERLNKRKLPSGNANSSKVEMKDNPTSESEPRRSNRKIQPTSRLLEGLQSSLSISKMPTVAHSSQRNHSKVMPKGSPRPG